MTDHIPELHTVHARRIHPDSWVPAGIETLPTGMVNVRLYDHDFAVGRDTYVIEPCPGIIHLESTVTQVVLVGADADGELWDEHGQPYDEHPVVIGTEIADPPHQTRHYADPQWRPSYVGGGYLGTCRADKVPALLVEHGFPDAVPHERKGW
ncbi:hypothetical protein L2K20_06075 [Mycobacterium sp. MBM]|nr:hypothetical protein [Mycobacterium sp. MBM]